MSDARGAESIRELRVQERMSVRKRDLQSLQSCQEPRVMAEFIQERGNLEFGEQK